jgi:phospholipid-binding lipoprotein MlaA
MSLIWTALIARWPLWRFLRRFSGRLLCVPLVLLASGCASLPAGSNRVAHDPLEPMNRVIFAVNDTIDAAFLKPVARAYTDNVHEGVREVFSNMFGNVADVWTAVNQLLQGKPVEAVGDLSRFVINSTLGFFGVADVASSFGFETHREDFGQTLGRWGLGSGPYLVLPFFGPSSLRDGVAFPIDYSTDPITRVSDIAIRNSSTAVRLVDTRAKLLPAEKLIEGGALDKYSFIRDGYLQRRRNLVYDGNPPEPKE